MDNIVLPDLQTFLIEPSFGDALAGIVEEEGISAVEAFLRDLDKAKQPVATYIQKKHGCGVVNINIKF